MDTTQELETSESYEIKCYHCKNSFDALDAVWCNCLAAERTLVCPNCLHCFCKATREYLNEFWDGAPQAIWDKKVAERKSLLLPPNPISDSAIRPIVLVVDDDELVLKLAVKAIQSFGYTVVFARDGLEALALARTYKPELILSDMLMPKMDGTKLCQFIKSDPATRNIKVVLMTSLYTKQKYRVALSKQSEPDDYLPKPLDFQKLFQLLNRYLPDYAGERK
jgi:CheY-like chemotaxis protein